VYNTLIKLIVKAEATIGPDTMAAQNLTFFMLLACFFLGFMSKTVFMLTVFEHPKIPSWNFLMFKIKLSYTSFILKILRKRHI
jgi:hypothetical protein